MRWKENRWLSAALIVVLSVTIIFFFNKAITTISDKISYAEDWKDKYPDQYNSYLKNAEMQRTTFGGSEPIDYLEKYPNLKILYDGYGFSIEYLRARGHVYSLEDVIHTARPKPGAACLSCKTPDYAAMINDFGKEFYAMDFEEMAAKSVSPISCFDCHQNTPGRPTITREHLKVALQDLDTEFKMGDLVCAQCHVEYYIHPDTKEVVLPWENGIAVEEIENTFYNMGYFDWIHPQTGTELIKIQHPEFEMFQESWHHSLGLSCIDCHMPKIENEKGERIPSHHWTSPLKYVENSCLSCHRESKEELILRVENVQREVEEKINEVSDLIVYLIVELSKGVESDNFTEGELEIIRDYHRRAQLRWDFVFVENSNGFHNPERAHELLEEAKRYAEMGLELLRKEQ